MRLKEFSIARYGPLKSTGRVWLRHFNLFWGKNEDGKTLTIDALVKLLLGRNAKDFKDIDRVEERPEGYVILEDDQGNEIKLPEKGDLTKVADSGLTPSECRNIFVIRNSDLSIAREREGEGKFYASVTNRLTGSRTEDILKTEKALRELGRITPTGEFRDTKEEKLKTLVEKAKELIGEVEALARKTEEERHDELEKESVQLREHIESIDQEVKDLEDARKRESYEKGKDALDKLSSALREVERLGIYSRDERQLWRDCEKNITAHSEQKERARIELQKIEGDLRDTSEKSKELENGFRVFERRKKELDDEVKPELKNYEMRLGEVKSKEGRNKFYAAAAITSSVLLAVSILAAVLRPSPMFYGLLALFLTATIIFSILRFSFMRENARLAAVFARTKLTVSRFELEAESPEKLYSSIEEFEEKYQEKSRDLQGARRRKEILEEAIKKSKEKEIPDMEGKIKEAQKKIEGIRLKSKAESLEEYDRKLALREEHEMSILKQEGILKSHLGEKSKKLGENISRWNEEIQKLEQYKDSAPHVTYSEAAKSARDEERRKRAARLQEVNETIATFRKEMKEIERKANESLKLAEPLYCDTSLDLKLIKAELQSFVQQNESNKDNASKAIEIFEQMERDEKLKASELFGDESPVSKYFGEITNGLYEGVLLNQGTMEIRTKRRDGVIMAAGKLSGGAYDQLYLSIRLALGEKLLKGKKGFFIMDDPLIKADPDRLQRQIQTLKRISELGWQVIYFSAKGEIKDALEDDIKRGAVNYVEIQGAFS